MSWPKGKTAHNAILSDIDFEERFTQIVPTKLAEELGITTAAVYQRRRSLEEKFGRPIIAPSHLGAPRGAYNRVATPNRLEYQISDGYVLIGSDAHYWPGIITTAHRGFVKFCKTLKPKAVILDGDIFDGASVSRFPVSSWAEKEGRPTVKGELETCQERMGEIERAAVGAKRKKIKGNHDDRWEKRLANAEPEFCRVKGFAFADHFPEWEESYSVFINGDMAQTPVWIGHDFKGGVYAGRNNTLNAGVHTVTGHLHRGTIGIVSDMRGTRYGVDLPCLAEPYGPQFAYNFDRPRDQRSGFGVLRFINGEMCAPQLALVRDEGVIDYGNDLIEV